MIDICFSQLYYASLFSILLRNICQTLKNKKDKEILSYLENPRVVGLCNSTPPILQLNIKVSNLAKVVIVSDLTNEICLPRLVTQYFFNHIYYDTKNRALLYALNKCIFSTSLLNIQPNSRTSNKFKKLHKTKNVQALTDKLVDSKYTLIGFKINECFVFWNYFSFMLQKCLNQQTKKDIRTVINRAIEFIT